jgi:membrane protease YdiL (CAAX protease family)
MSHSARTWLWLLPAMLVPGVLACVYFVWLSDSQAGSLVYGAAKLFLLAFPLVALGGVPRVPFRHAPVDRGRSVLWGLVTGVTVAGAAFGLMAIPAVGGLVWSAGPAVTAKAVGLGFARHFVLFALFVSLAHSAIEEYYWRWFVFRGVRARLGAFPAHALAAAAFALHHLVVTWQYFPPVPAVVFASAVAVGGAIWSLLYERHGSLLGPWLSHLVVDLAIMSIGYKLLVANGAV